MNNFFVVILLILACYRLSEMITLDDGPAGIFKRIRAFLGIKASAHREYGFFWSLAELFNCPFCMGIWIALPLVLVLKPINIIYFFIYWFAIAGGQSFLQSISNKYNSY